MNKRQNISRNIIYILMVFSLSYIFALVIEIDLSLPLQAIIVVIISLLIKFFVLRPIFIYALTGLGVFSILLMNYFFPLLVSPFFQRSRSFFTNIFHNLQSNELIALENRLLFWIILSILLAFFTGFIIFKKKKLYPLLPLYLGFFLYYWYNYVDAAYWMMILFLFLFFIYMALIKYSLETFEQNKSLTSDFKELYKPWMKTGIIYGIIIIVLAISLPKTSNVIKWSWLQNRVYEVFPEIESWRSSSTFSRQFGEISYFDFSSTGYSSSPSKLGGPVELGDEKVMTVYSDGPEYLRGNIKHRYTGSYWEVVGSTLEDHRSGSDISGLSKLEKSKYYEMASIRITYNSFSSMTIFSPYRPGRVSLKDNSRLKADKDFALLSTNGIYTGESYSLGVQKPLTYGELIDTDISYEKEDILDLNKYLEVPEDKITQATRDLTKNIVGDIQEDIDKALAMEDFLRSNYEYSLDVSPIPEGREFIDYFLFEEKKGYCTYYATTLAIMLRLENIPSRYVEGYLAKDQVEDGVYEVTQKNGHTWVEAFIEPVGWIRLEATPAYAPGPNSLTPEGTDQAEDSDEPLFPDRDILEENRGDAFNGEENVLNGSTDIENIDDGSEDNVESNPQKYIFIFLVLLFSILPLRILFVFFKLKVKDRKIKALNPRKQVIYLYKDILNLTKVLGYPQRLGETHGEYANRIAFNFYYFDDKSIKDITDIFLRSKYGVSKSSKEDICEMEKFKENLNRRVRSNLGFFEYLQFYLRL